MLVTYTTTASGNGDMTITLAAKADRITRILYAQGCRLSTTVLDIFPFLSISNCLNADGTTFTAIWRPEEEGGGAGGWPRQARSILYDPPWRMTIKPGLPTAIFYSSGAASAAGYSLIVGYKYE